MSKRNSFLNYIITFICLIFLRLPCFAQNNLYQIISADIKNQRLEDALVIISKKGNFHFSYSSSFIPQDNIVSVKADNYTVKEVLDILLDEKYEYKEANDYIILRPAPYRLKLTPEEIETKGNWYTVTGFITDEQTGAKVAMASVYEKRLLNSTLTDNRGYFKLKLKKKESEIALTVSKELYRDVTFVILPSTMVSPDGNDNSQYAPEGSGKRVEETAFGRLFITSKQKIQSINLTGLLAKSPFQASLTPGLSTHGLFNSQVESKFSLNLAGGYSTGVKGIEVAAGFNINKRNVRYFQAAGIFNVVGGSILGGQFAGINNTVMDSVQGMQAAGIYNQVRGKVAGAQFAGVANIDKKNMEGMQAAGVFNYVERVVKGTQVAGAANVAKDSLSGFQISGGFNNVNRKVKGGQISGGFNWSGEEVKGVQLSGVFNHTNGNVNGVQITGGVNNGREVKGVQVTALGNISKEMRGLQLSALFNYARTLKGVQIGIINFAGSSDGVSLGILNFVKGGYRKISIFHNEVTDTNISLKTGNSKLYSIITAGSNLSGNGKAYSMGFGLGHDFIISKRILLSTDLISSQIYTGSWNELNHLSRAKASASVKILKGISIFAGPAINAYYLRFPQPHSPEFKDISTSGKFSFDYTKDVKGWVGFEAGVTFF